MALFSGQGLAEARCAPCYRVLVTPRIHGALCRIDQLGRRVEVGEQAVFVGRVFVYVGRVDLGRVFVVMTVTCPLCKKTLKIGSINDLPTFPFCSDRCRLVDLGRWIDGDYAIPADARKAEDEAAPGPERSDVEEEADA
jgi:endogenous inhibitor of DNA gyrase (YacG/DUF329 family)